MAFLVSLALITTLPLAAIPERDKSGGPHIRSESVVIRDVATGQIILQRNADVVRPIASVTKLLSAIVLGDLDAEQAPPTDPIVILEEDKDRLKWSRSRMRVGLSFKPDELIQAALVASDNRAMYAAVRSRGLTRDKFVERMNERARKLGMERSEFRDPAGIDPGNVSTAKDLLSLLEAAAQNEHVATCAHLARLDLVDTSSKTLSLGSPNVLARSGKWKLVVAKTGYTVEAGRAFAVRAQIQDHIIDMVFLGAREMKSVFGDAGRVRRWLEERWAREGGRVAP